MPRSRGVYRRLRPAAMTCWGSSPLARGLPPEISRRHDRGGIIPARAGFTTRTPRLSPTIPDHPRSRGVYSLTALYRSPSNGSSPLARGLQRVLAFVEVQVGIIPARAGFTAHGGSVMNNLEDHPRSRGVYVYLKPPEAPFPGSSPLARGLLRVNLDHARRAGIIPARAGFTEASEATPSGPRDHPRSRGVYVARGKMTMSADGSSPLARGLRRRRAVGL